MINQIQTTKKNKIQCLVTNKHMKRSHSTQFLAHTQPQSQPITPKNNQMKRLSSTQIFSFSHSKTTKTLKKKTSKKLLSTETKSIKTFKKKKREERSEDKENVRQKVKNKKGKNKSKKNKIKLKQKTFQQKIQELTERKKLHLEYFYFKNICIPLQNTEQRKLAYKINLINSQQPFQCKTSRRDKGMNTQQKNVKQVSTQMLENKKQAVSIQTESNRMSTQSQQKTLCQLLSQLQFYYLPDDKNFQDFTETEKQHYKDVLMFAIKKFDKSSEEQKIDEDKLKTLLYQRECAQRGIIQSFYKEGFPTHIPSIFSYLSHFFCYIEIKEKAKTVERLNSMYGYNCADKLRLIRNNESTKRNFHIIPEHIFIEVEEQIFQDLKFESEFAEETVHYHNKVIFDVVNEIMSEFQPYYLSNGQLFPWNKNIAGMTFYSIDMETFEEMVMQVKDRVCDIASTLAGLLLNTGQQRYRVHIQKILQNEKKMIQKEARRNNDSVDIDECGIRIRLQLSDMVMQELMEQIFDICFGF